MFMRHGSLSRRDAFLLLLGASTMHIWSLFFPYRTAIDSSIVIDTNLPEQAHHVRSTTAVFKETATRTLKETLTQVATTTATLTASPTSHALLAYDDIPSTEVLAHAPGWTLFRNLYMSNGTLYVVADEKARAKLPEIRLMVSTPLEAFNTPENIAAREPTPSIMTVISPREATERWTRSAGKGKGQNTVLTVEGNTVLSWDPTQFLRHYFHLVAEMFFGVQAFWHGAFSKPVPPSNDLKSPHFALHHPDPPPIDRLIFAYSNWDGWRDSPGFNRYFLRAVYPSLTIEHQEDWQDRVEATRAGPGETAGKAFMFTHVLLIDRSASHRGQICGSENQRTAAEAWDYMRTKGKLMGIHVGGWWAPVREAMWRFAGAEVALESLATSHSQRSSRQQLPLQISDSSEIVVADAATADEKAKAVNIGSEHQKLLPPPEKIVISYISRQTARHRKLIVSHHQALVKSLRDLVKKKNKERRAFIDNAGGEEDERRRAQGGQIPLEWEFQELIAEDMSKDEQIREASRTTFMVGVHGNGLTHLVFMNPNRYSTVIEIFYPEGFAHDYWWTTRSLGMTHHAVWNDRTYETKPGASYPPGFQDDEIPVSGSYVVKVIEDRVVGKL